MTLLTPKYCALRNKSNVQRELGDTPAHTIQSTYHGRWTVCHWCWTQSYANTAQFLVIRYGRPEQSSTQRHTKTRSSSVVSRANTSHDNTAVTHEHPRTSSPSPSHSSDLSHRWTNTPPHGDSHSVTRHRNPSISSTVKMSESRRSSVIHSRAAFLTL